MLNHSQQRKKNLLYWTLAIYWALLFIGTSLPSHSIPSLDVGDKFQHMGAYFILTVLINLTIRFQAKYEKLKLKSDFYSVIIAAVYGLADELHQIIIPGRSCELLDWLADMLGAILAVLLLRYFFKNTKFKFE